MSDYDNDLNKTSGELNGFDEVNGEDTANNGYTVTPEGGFYTKSREDIIQDDISGNNTAYTAEPINNQTYTTPEYDNNPPKKHGFFPNGEYGTYNTDIPNPQPQPFYNYQPPKKQKPKKDKRYGAGVIVVASLLAAVIGAASGIAVIKSTDTQNNPTEIINSDTNGKNVNINIDETAETVVEAVAKKVTPSVIGIRTTTAVTNFFGGSSESTGEGSGVIYSSDGYIITNYHVISGAANKKAGSKIEVFVDSLNSKSYEATVIGYNIAADLAVIKINATGLTAVEFADSSTLKVGQYVITVGNPGGLEFMDSVTYGVVSGLDRVVSASSDVKLIQTDAAINPGNSGGALVNAKGKLVGINSSKIVSEEYEGMGFAIPSNTVDSICKRIIEKQNDPEPYTGITISEKYTASVLKYYGFPSGAVILSVADGSPAEKAGLAKGDIITEFDGKDISEYTVLENLLEDCSPNQTVNVKIYRSGRYYTTELTVGSNNAVK